MPLIEGIHQAVEHTLDAVGNPVDRLRYRWQLHQFETHMKELYGQILDGNRGAIAMQVIEVPLEKGMVHAVGDRRDGPAGVDAKLDAILDAIVVQRETRQPDTSL